MSICVSVHVYSFVCLAHMLYSVLGEEPTKNSVPDAGCSQAACTLSEQLQQLETECPGGVSGFSGDVWLYIKRTSNNNNDWLCCDERSTM